MNDKDAQNELFNMLGQNFIYNGLLDEDEQWADYFDQHIKPVLTAFERFDTLGKMAIFLMERGRNGLATLEDIVAQRNKVLDCVHDLEVRRRNIDADIASMHTALDVLRIKYDLCDPSQQSGDTASPSSKCPCKAASKEQQQ